MKNKPIGAYAHLRDPRDKTDVAQRLARTNTSVSDFTFRQPFVRPAMAHLLNMGAIPKAFSGADRIRLAGSIYTPEILHCGDAHCKHIKSNGQNYLREAHLNFAHDYQPIQPAVTWARPIF